MHSIIKKYNDLKIGKKLILIFLLISVIPIVLLQVYHFASVRRNMTNQVNEIIYNDLIQISERTNLSLENYTNLMYQIYVDDIIFGIYLERHPKLKSVIDDAGGYQTILDMSEYTKEESFWGYVDELRKWNVLLKLAKHGWIDKDRMPEYADMSAQDIYDSLEVLINDIFINISHDVKSYDITSGIDELIKELDEGMAIGLPYKDLPMLTAEIGGMYMGGITLIGALSNVGKSSLVRNTMIPSIIKNNERIVIILNEEDLKKMQRELIISVANNILGYDIQKHILRDGHFNDETREILSKSVNWIKEHTANHTITIIPFQQYRTDTAIKVIKKYASMGVKYFLLDTFKMDAGRVSDKSWLELQQNMVAINDVIKPEANNLHITITFQLAKGSAKQRYYTQDNIGVAKNIIDPVSTCLMIRNVLPDEIKGGKRELKVYKLGGKNGNSKIPVKLEDDKYYQVIFIIKNREGSANNFQIVIEHDMSRNILKEIGICSISPDTF